MSLSAATIPAVFEFVWSTFQPETVPSRGTKSRIVGVVVWPLLPKMLAIPSPSQLRAVNVELQKEKAALEQTQGELRRAYDAAVGSFERSVRPSGERLVQLGGGSAGDSSNNDQSSLHGGWEPSRG